MVLREILQKLVNEGNSASLIDGDKTSQASLLLDTLSEQMLKRQAYLQPGMYIAEINDQGYLGRVLYRLSN